MNLRCTAIGLIALALATWAPRAVPAQERELIAVLDLQPVATSEAQASALTDRLREELLRSGRFELVDRSQIASVLDEQALQQSGCTEQECAVQVGRILGVRKMIAGKVTKLSDRLWLVSGIMVDVETARTERAESVSVQGEFVEVLTGGMAELARKLSEPPARPAPGAVAAVPAPPPAQEEAVLPAAEPAARRRGFAFSARLSFAGIDLEGHLDRVSILLTSGEKTTAEDDCKDVVGRTYLQGRYRFGDEPSGWYLGGGIYSDKLKESGCGTATLESGGTILAGYYWIWDNGVNFDFGLRPGLMALGYTF